MRNILYVDLAYFILYFNYVVIFFVIYYLFLVKVWVMGAGMGTYIPIGYGDGHQTYCPRGYGLGYGDFLKTRVWGWALWYPAQWVPIAIPNFRSSTPRY